MGEIKMIKHLARQGQSQSLVKKNRFIAVFMNAF